MSASPNTPEADTGTARDALLEAAIHEFAERGYEGVRLEHVARRADCNRSLIYRYFGDREGLFEEALRAQFARRAELLDEVPRDFEALLSWWTGKTLDDPTFIRMILRESLDYAGGEPIESNARSGYYGRQLEMLDALRERGRLDPDFDLEILFLALLSVVILPAIMPQVVLLVTGEESRSDAFKERWDRFLGQLAYALEPRGAAIE